MIECATIGLTAPEDLALDAGDMCALASAPLFHAPVPVLICDPSGPCLRAGQTLSRDGQPVFRVAGRMVWPMDRPAPVVAALTALRPTALPGQAEFSVATDGFSLAWITLSDKGSRGERVDASGPLIEEMARADMPVSIARGQVIPDDLGLLRGLLATLALIEGFDVILTTGGTGLGPRDITPEATLPLIEKRLPGFERAMTAVSLQKTPHAAISRAVAGTIGQSIVVNLPGSPKAVRETLQAILPALPHAVEKLRGDPADCGG